MRLVLYPPSLTLYTLIRYPYTYRYLFYYPRLYYYLRPYLLLYLHRYRYLYRCFRPRRYSPT